MLESSSKGQFEYHKIHTGIEPMHVGESDTGEQPTYPLQTIGGFQIDQSLWLNRRIPHRDTRAPNNTA